MEGEIWTKTYFGLQVMCPSLLVDLKQTCNGFSPCTCSASSEVSVTYVRRKAKCRRKSTLVPKLLTDLSHSYIVYCKCVWSTRISRKILAVEPDKVQRSSSKVSLIVIKTGCSEFVWSEEYEFSRKYLQINPRYKQIHEYLAVFSIFHAWLIKFGMWDLNGIQSFNSMFHWTRCSQNHYLRYGVNNFLPYFLHFCPISLKFCMWYLKATLLINFEFL